MSNQNNFNQNFWKKRYQDKETAWDIGAISTPLKTYIDQLEDKTLHILIPGAGNSYEAEYLHNQGFSNVFVLDLASEPLESLRLRCPSFPEAHLIEGDFFELDKVAAFDLILEQTFFCALSPHLRPQYVQKMKSLLKPEGKLVGVLFADTLLGRELPPFGETTPRLKQYFQNDFVLNHFAPCYNSIKPRQGSEVFIHLSPIL